MTNQLKKFLDNDASWVKDCQDNRVYLKNDHLVIAEDGIYVLDESNKKIPLTELFVDSQGIYTRIESLGTDIAAVYGIVWCKNCEAYRTVDWKGLCVVCGKRPY